MSDKTPDENISFGEANIGEPNIGDDPFADDSVFTDAGITVVNPRSA